MSDNAELLARRLEDARADAKNLAIQNETLTKTLRDARTQLVALKNELEELGHPPLSRGRVLAAVEPFIDVVVMGRTLRVAASTEFTQSVEPGDEVLLNEAMVVVAKLDADAQTAHDLGFVVETAGDQAIVTAGQDEIRVQLVGKLAAEPPRAGDCVLLDRGAGFALAIVERKHVEELVLKEVPDVSYTDIGGLSEQIERIRDAVELPFLHRDRYAAYNLKAPKGILLYGPPGCGKTMIAKAVARSLADQLSAGKAPSDTTARTSCFISVKGPELLNKYVGESERHIRLIFERAREQATAGIPVIVFFDEMDSLFRTRGSGVSSDVESTVVPQLLSEIDGVEGLDNVIVIGASNREDMIDPAILRPGRLDVKIKLDRPTRTGASEIIAKYLTSDVPLADEDLTLAQHNPDRCVDELIEATVERIYAQTDWNKFIQVIYASGDVETLYFSDFASGAMLRNVVDRAKKVAIKDELAGGGGGVSREGLMQACLEEFIENEDLPNTTNPDDWARISGRKGERIAFIQSLVATRSV